MNSLSFSSYIDSFDEGLFDSMKQGFQNQHAKSSAIQPGSSESDYEKYSYSIMENQWKDMLEIAQNAGKNFSTNAKVHTMCLERTTRHANLVLSRSCMNWTQRRIKEKEMAEQEREHWMCLLGNMVPMKAQSVITT